MRACYLPLLNVLQITVTWGKGGNGLLATSSCQIFLIGICFRVENHMSICLRLAHDQNLDYPYSYYKYFIITYYFKAQVCELSSQANITY